MGIFLSEKNQSMYESKYLNHDCFKSFDFSFVLPLYC